jgi:hypothetical protein
MVYLFCSDYDQITFIYDPKFLTGHPREFQIGFRLDIIEPILEDCLQIKEAIRSGRPPKRPGWAKEDLSTCTTCPFYMTCWHHDGRSHSTPVRAIDTRPR